MTLQIFSSCSDSDSDMEIMTQLSDWDSTDSEGLHRARSSKLKRVNYMQSLEDAEFTLRFRLPKSTVNCLLSEIMPLVRVTSSRNHGVAPLHQLLLTLRFYALGTMLLSVADFVGVSRSTASRIIRDISSAIAHLYDKYIFLSLESAQIFYEIAQFPRVLGAIDCTHIQIASPRQFIGEEFRNCKGYYSINVQAVCDANLRFMNIVARWPGSTHDATIFNNSVLRVQCDAGQFSDRWLLGDGAYPNRSYLLTPLSNPHTEAEQRYNDAHIKTRYTIERTFEVWKRRFPVVGLPLRLSLPVVQDIIIATGVLHNICRNNNFEELLPEVDLPLPSHSNIEAEPNMDSTDDHTRTELINYYFS